MPTKTEGQFVCPVCGRSFSLERGLTRHQNYAHPEQTLAQALEPVEPAPEPAAPAPQADPAMAAMAAPLKQEAAKIEAELAELDGRRELILARLRPLRNAIRALEGTGVYGGKPGPKPGNGKPAKKASGGPRHASAELVSQVYSWLEAHAAELAEGFTGTTLYKQVSANGGLTVSEDRLRLVLKQLHDQGLIRLDRKTQGGGKLFKLTAAGGDTQA